MRVSFELSDGYDVVRLEVHDFGNAVQVSIHREDSPTVITMTDAGLIETLRKDGRLPALPPHEYVIGPAERNQIHPDLWVCKRCLVPRVQHGEIPGA